MKIDEIFAHRLSASDLAAGPKAFVIKGWSMADFPKEGGGSEKKPEIAFEGTENTFICNPTNLNTIKSLYPCEDTDETIGKEIVLYKTKTPFGGKMVDCIRIKAEEGPF